MSSERKYLHPTQNGLIFKFIQNDFYCFQPPSYNAGKHMRRYQIEKVIILWASQKKKLN